MRRIVGMCAAAIVALGSCGGVAGDDPTGATRAFLGAVKRGDCATAWTFFSRGTQENVTAQVKKEIREAPYPIEHLRPQDKYCQGTYGDARPRTARLVDEDGDAAVVSVGFAEGTHFPLIPFLSTPYHEWSADIRLIREDGRWKVERPRVEVGRPGWDLVEVGEVHVTYNRSGNPRRRWVEAEAVVHTSRDVLEATLMDVRTWSRVLPLVTKARALEGAGESAERRVLLRFGTPDAAAEVVVVVKPYGHLRDPRLPWTKIQLVAATDVPPAPANVARPTIYSGSWELRERYDGFWVTFGFVIQPDEWPPRIVEGLLASDSVAGAVTALEREATRLALAADR